MEHHDYIIADIRLRTDRSLVDAGLRGFAPFESAVEGVADSIFITHEGVTVDGNSIIKRLSESYLSEANADGVLYKTTEGYLYRITPRCNENKFTDFAIELRTKRITTNIFNDSVNIAILRFGLWIMFGVVLATHNAIAIHSSVIECEGRAVLFLGESGMGKSTHTRLWRENIEGAHLLNDDSPIVRMADNRAVVYGSPWSGKRACYRNLSYPIAAFCRLNQAPHNAINRLSSIAAIGAILPSTPPQFAHDDNLQDAICETLGKLLQCVPVFHLACLPNRDAALLSYKTTISDESGIK